MTPESTCNECGDRCNRCAKRDKKTKQYIRTPCPGKCGFRERVFKTLYDLGRWIFHENHRGYTVVFHNLSYDGQFLLQYLISQTIRPSFIIYRGSKVQMFNVNALQIKVIDSFNFLPMALAKFPGAFQLESLAKGYFPHFFTCRENLSYVGLYPPPETYWPDGMSIEGREKFYEWYREKIDSGEVFDFHSEMVKYCRSDVDILRRACIKFKHLLHEATSRDGGRAIDPFDSCTRASLCMKVYKQKFLEEQWQLIVKENDQEIRIDVKKINGKTSVLYQNVWIDWNEFKKMNMEIIKEVFVKSPIARPPPNGYQVRIPFSRKSIAWLELLMQRARTNGQHLDICHALNGRGEYRVPETRYRLDGYVAPTTEFPAGIAYEFHGCHFHGCLTCFKKGGDILFPNSENTASELLARTRTKERKLKSLGMKLVIWEHKYDNMFKEDPDAKTFVENLDLTERLDPRDSLMGGRTNGCVLYKRAPRDTKIKYVDFTSMYPFVNKTARYPTGHPEIITREFDDISKYFGLAKVKVFPPRGLFHSVTARRES